MASSHHNNFKELPKALTFDVFGTVVNWRKTVTKTLTDRAQVKLSSSSTRSNLPVSTLNELSKLHEVGWGAFAQEWRNSYMKFTRGFVPGETEWQDIDTHHHMALIDLLEKWKLEGLYTDDEVKDLSLIWHFLEPWSDSSIGLHMLGTKFITSSLSNGNQSLLQDLDRHGDLGFKVLQSAADFKAYKPHASVYAGAAKTLGLEPSEVAMVAAHLGDLRAAHECGFRTIYVERLDEEEHWKAGSEEYKNAKTWVDMWVGLEQDGFVEVARRFGIE